MLTRYMVVSILLELGHSEDDIEQLLYGKQQCDDEPIIVGEWIPEPRDPWYIENIDQK